MKLSTTILALIILGSLSLLSQKTEELSYKPGYTDDIFFSLEEASAVYVSNSDWDIALSASGQGAAGSTILINETYHTLYSVPSLSVSQWDEVDISNIGVWKPLYNIKKSWTDGAFNLDRGGLSEWDFGWGEINVESGRYQTQGDSIYVIEFEDGSYKKLRIDTLVSSVWTLTYADIDGSNEVTLSISKKDYPNKNFIYVSMKNKQVIDREPVNSSWDLLFTRYRKYIDGMGMFPTAACLSNNNISIAKVENIGYGGIDEASTEFSEDIDLIGSTFKALESSTWYVFYDVYFIKKSTVIDGNEKEQIFKLAFESFEGTSTGNFSFKHEALITSLDDLGNANNNILLYPNPAENNVNLVLNNTEAGWMHIEIFSLSGELVKEFSVESGGMFQAKNINISELSSGAYILQYKINNTSNRVKLMVK